MPNYKVKHEVLETLIEIEIKNWDREPFEGAEYSFVVIELLKYNAGKTYAACGALVETGDIVEITDDQFNVLYKITNRGRNSYNERIYLNQIWYRSQRFWLSWIPIVISITALLIALFD